MRSTAMPAPDCPGCGRPLQLVQPVEAWPDGVIGACERCSAAAGRLVIYELGRAAGGGWEVAPTPAAVAAAAG